MADEHRRALDFCRRADMAGAREEPSPLGRAVFDDELALRHDSNYLDVARAGSLDELEAELVRLGLRAAFFEDAKLGESLAAGAAAHGWAVHRGVVMVHRRDTGRAFDRGAVREVGEGELRPLRRERILAEHWGTPELAEQLLDAKVRIAGRVTARFFAAYADGAAAACADLYVDAPTAQIEEVVTAPAQRERGLGSAVVLTALAEARAAGADFVFLVADADDWPRHWYERLGFEAVGRYVKLVRPR